MAIENERKDNARIFYNLRKNNPGEKVKNPRIEFMYSEPIPIEKMSGQIVDPFTEASGFKDYYPTPYNLTNLLNFYYDNTWHSACCRIKAQAIGGGFEIVGIEKDQKPDREYEMLNEFLNNINSDFEDLVEVLNRVIIDFESMGNAYIEIVRNRMGQITELFHVPAHTVRKHQVKNGYVQIRVKTGIGTSSVPVYFKKYGDNDDREGKTELIAIKQYFPASKYYGLPNFMPALGAMTMDRSAVIFNNNFFNNSGMMGMILSLKGASLNNTTKGQLRKLLASNFTGVDNAYRMALIEDLPDGSELKIDKIFDSIKDMSFERLRKFNRDEILAAHLVPPKMLYVSSPGQLGETNDGYNQMKFFKMIEVDPKQSKIERIVNKIIKDEKDISRWRIKFKELDIRSAADLNTEIWGDVNSGVRTIDEARLIRGLDQADINKRNADILGELNRIEKRLLNM